MDKEIGLIDLIARVYERQNLLIGVAKICFLSCT